MCAPTNFFIQIGIKTSWDKINKLKYRPYLGLGDYRNKLWNSVDEKNVKYIDIYAEKKNSTLVDVNSIYYAVCDFNDELKIEDLVGKPFKEVFKVSTEYEAETKINKEGEDQLTYYYNVRYEDIDASLEEIIKEIDFLVDI